MLILFLAAFFSLRDVIPQFTTHVIVVTAGLVAGIHINAALAMLIGAAGIGSLFGLYIRLNQLVGCALPRPEFTLSASSQT